MGKKLRNDPLGILSGSEDVAMIDTEKDPLGILSKKKEDTVSAQSSEGGGTGQPSENSSTVSSPQSTPSEKNGKINPAVANAFEVSRRGKEYQQIVRAKSKAITDKINAYRAKTIAELQPTIRTQEEADAANKKLNEDLHNIYQTEVGKANEEILPVKKAFHEAYNSPFKDKEYAKGFQETYSPNAPTQFPLTTSMVKAAQSAFTDLLPGQSAAAMAGLETANYDKFLVNKLSTFNPNDYWNPEAAYKKREKEVVDKYIKEVGLPQYEKEKKEFEEERSKEKEKLLEYSARQEGQAAGKLGEYPASFKDIKDVPTALQYIGKNIGQTAGFMAPTIATSLINPTLGAATGLTLNSAVEKGEAYKEGLGLIEENTGLSKKELFRIDADAALRDATTRSGLINGLMEYASEITTVGKLMPKNYLAASIANLMRNKKALGISVGTATEGITEWLQAKDDHYAAAIGARQTPEEARDYAMGQDDTEEFLAGITGGLGVSGIAHAVNPHTDRIDKTTEEIDNKFGKIETPNLDKQLNKEEHASKISGSAPVGEFTERPSSTGGSGSARMEQSLERPQTPSENNSTESEKKKEEVNATTNGVVGEQGSAPTETANISTIQTGLTQERTPETANPEATDETGRTGQQVQRDENNQGTQGNEGEKETLGIAFAPYRSKNVSTLEQANEVRQAEDYKIHQQVFEDAAKGLGIEVNHKKDTWGGYVDSETGKPVHEVSNVITVNTTPEKAELLAAIIGKAAPEEQDSVLVGHNSTEGHGTEYLVHTGSFDNAQKAIEALKSNGLQYFTIDESNGDIIIIDTDDSQTDNVINFTKDLQKGNIYGGAESTNTNASFVQKESYDGIIAKSRDKVRAENGFDIDAFVSEATRKYAQQRKPELQTSGIKKALVPENKSIPTEPTTHQELLDKAKKEVDEGKINPEEIVDEVNESPRAIQPHEVAALVYYKGQLDNQFIKATKAVAEAETPEAKETAERNLAALDAKIDAYHTAALHTARQQSLAFGLRKMMVDSEYNLVTQVEKFKHENKGVIPDDVLAKFKENDKQLKEANQRILELESKEKERLAIEQLKDIAKLERNKAAKGQRKAQKERISNAFDKWKIKGPKAKVATATIPGLNFAPDLWNGAVEAMKQTVLATYDITQALKAGIDYLKSKGQQVDEKAFEAHFMPLMEKAIPAMESISGKIKVPQNMLLSMVESGVDSIEELTKRVHSVAQKANPEITEREVRDAITDFGRTRGISKNEILSKLNTLKRIGRLISRIENLRENKPLVKNSKKLNSESEKEKSLKAELSKLLKSNPEFHEEQLSKTKRNVEKSIAEYSRRIKEGDFTSKEKKVLTPDKELKELYQKKESAITAYEEAHEKNRLNNRKAAEIATDAFFSAFNAPKALLSSLDLSAPGRQGIYFLSHPKAFGTALIDMFKQLGSQNNYDNYLATIKNSEYWPILNKSKLALTSTGGKLSAREELFMNRLTKWLPWVRISERAYSGFLNSLRLNVFMEGIAQLEKAGIHFENNPEEYIRLAEHVNTGTGRSNLGTKGENASKLLNSIFFSPRFFASRLKIATTNNMLLADPNTYKDNPRGKVNRMILLDQARFFGFNALLLGLLGKTVPDWEVEWNPLSSNFAKIKIGKNWYDITGGTAPILRYLVQSALGKHKVKERITDKSRLETLVTGATHKDRQTGQEYHTSSLMRSKLSPTVGMLYNLADNQYDLSGQKMTAGSVFMNYFVPLIVNEAIQQQQIITKQNRSAEWQKAQGIKPEEKRGFSEMALPLAASTVGISSTPER